MKSILANNEIINTFNQNQDSLLITDQNQFKLQIKNIPNKKQIKKVEVKENIAISIEDLKVFSNLEILSMRKSFLSYDEFKNLYQYFPHLKRVIYGSVANEVLGDYYNNKKFHLVTLDGKDNIYPKIDECFITGLNSFQILLNIITHKEQIKSVNIVNQTPITVEDLKVFPNLEEIYDLNNLSYDDFKKIPLYFPRLTILSCKLPDKGILEDYNQNNYNFKIKTDNPEFSVNKYNPLLKYARDKFDLKTIYKVAFDNNISMIQDHLEELCQSTQEIEKLEFDYMNFRDIINIIQILKSRSIKINAINIKCKNKTYPEINDLKRVCQDYNVRIDYSPNFSEYPGIYIFNVYESCTIDEFIGLRATIDYFLNLIKDNKLSPFEQTIFVYDIIKTLKYAEDKDNKNNSRYLHSIVKTGEIVCYGYATFIAQLLKELGISANECGIYSPKSSEEDYHSVHPEQTELNHSRTLIRIDDDKYNIHGLFCADPTFDSSPQHGLNIYECFLLNYNEYNEAFPKDSLPELFYEYLFNIHSQSPFILNLDYTYKNFSYYGRQMLTELFGENPNSKLIAEYMECEPISIEKFTKVIRVVRKCEGYPEDYIDDEINKVKYHLNRIYSEVSQISK